MKQYLKWGKCNTDLLLCVLKRRFKLGAVWVSLTIHVQSAPFEKKHRYENNKRLHNKCNFKKKMQILLCLTEKKSPKVKYNQTKYSLSRNLNWHVKQCNIMWCWNENSIFCYLLINFSDFNSIIAYQCFQGQIWILYKTS